MDINEIGSYASIIGGIAVLFGGATTIWRRRNFRTWRFVKKEINALHAQMSTNYSPDVVVSIAREGTVIGSLLALNHRLKPLLVLERRFEEKNGRTTAIIDDTVLVRRLKNKKVLLVDCEVNTGSTLEAAVKYLESKGVKQIRTLVLMKREGSNFKVDYCRVTYRKRLYMPWEWTKQIRLIRHGSPETRWTPKNLDKLKNMR